MRDFSEQEVNTITPYLGVWLTIDGVKTVNSRDGDKMFTVTKGMYMVHWREALHPTYGEYTIFNNLTFALEMMS